MALRNKPLAFFLAGTSLAAGCGQSSGNVTETPDAGSADASSELSLSDTTHCLGDACVCSPGEGTCANGKASACRADGTGFVDFECDPVQGMTCAPDGCKGQCSLGELFQSYIGCDYFPTVTLNPVWSGFDFAAAVGNTSTQMAHVTVTRGASSVETRVVAPGGLEIFKLPWVTELKGGDVDACQLPPDPGVTRIVAGGAYRLRSDVPVTVYQLSPLTYEIDPPPAACPVGTQCQGGTVTQCKSYSNDASLLMPVNALTGNYTALAWPANGNRAGFITVTATADDTDVEIVGSGQFSAGAGIDASGNGTVKLKAGDVLEVLSKYDSVNPTANTFGADISGTRVRASHPVQVIGGHSCARVPLASTGYCDHLEQAMFPAETLGKDYLVTFPAAPGSVSPHVIRVMAINDATKIHFDPPLMADATLSPADPPLQLVDVKQDVRITGDQPIIVAQYMEGSSAVDSGSGDPSMSLAIPTAQFRSDYLFFASGTYDTNFVNVTAPSGTTVTLDGTPVPASEFQAIGSSGYSVARHELAGTDVHTIRAGRAFGITVYGYGKDTSYMYPGGLDLKHISPPPVK